MDDRPEFEGGFLAIPNKIHQIVDSHAELSVLLFFLQRCDINRINNGKSECYAAYPAIIKACKVSRGTLGVVLNTLCEQKNFVDRIQRKGRQTNLYRVNIDIINIAISRLNGSNPISYNHLAQR